MVDPRRERAPHESRRGAGPIGGAVASGEPQGRALRFPVEGKPSVIDEPARRQVGGMAPLEDRLGDVGSEEG